MKRYSVTMHETEINSYRAARAAYEGMTLDETLNRLDLSPSEEHLFTDEAEARAYLNSKTNDYFFNDSGYGYAREWYLEEQEVDEDGDVIDSYGFDDCPNSNLSEFLARMNREEEE